MLRSLTLATRAVASRLLSPQLQTGRLACRHEALHSSACLQKLSEFQMKKILTEFDHIYDGNNDGYFDWRDVERFKRKMREYLVIVKGTYVPGGYKESYSDFWALLLEKADTNGDKFISRVEWVDLWTEISGAAPDTSFKSLPQWVQLVPDSLFPVIDAKADGVIDKEEYSNFWHHVGGFPSQSRDRLDEIYNELTENRTIPFDLKRFENLYADFYLSDDPSTPGKYVAGPIRYD